MVTPPPFPELAAAAEHGPVIVINISSYRCDALILTDDTVRLVALPELSAEAVTEQTSALLEAADNAAQGMTPVLEWIWDQIVAPVFSRLGLTSPPAPSQQVPHIWWCPTAIAAFLPLHAAGRYLADGPDPDAALSMTVSSYTPTLRSLIQLRKRQTRPALPVAGPLIVAMPQTPGAPGLPGASAEASDITRRFTNSTCLSGSSATHAAVTRAMTRHPWAHFACHAVQDLLAPSRGRLVRSLSN
jgi:hypothetical protein